MDKFQNATTRTNFLAAILLKILWA